MNQDLLLESYNYELPEELIAQRPADLRHESRLLIYDEAGGEVIHTRFSELPKFLKENDCLVFNQSKVFPCRLKGYKLSGGKIEIFVLDLNPIKAQVHRVLLRANGKKNIGLKIQCGKALLEVVSTFDDGTFAVKFPDQLDVHSFLQKHGHVPIPPYIRGGEDSISDRSEYQTVYAKEIGSVAAPTAGLHFSHELLKTLKNPKAYTTLHVGLGTFKPVSANNIVNHQMHSEQYYVDKENLGLLKNQPRKIAVGTTSLRVLESLRGRYDEMQSWQSTDIFLYPGVSVESVVGLITNFHLPKSSLLMLVSSLIGREKTLELYKEAIREKYRFFSYGDAMLILRKSWRAS